MDTSPASSPAAPRPFASALGLLLSLMSPLLWVLAVASLLLGLAAAGVRWAVASEDGTRWLLQHTPHVSASGWQGALLGERWQAKQLRISWDGGRQSLLLDDVQAEGVHITWWPADGPPGCWLAVRAAKVQGRLGTLVTGPSNDKPLQLPRSLALPLQVTVEEGTLQTLQIDKAAPLTTLRVQGFALDSREGANHSARSFALQWQGWAIAGQAHVAHAAPMPLKVTASVTPAADGGAPAWAAVLRGSGPLAGLNLQATLRGVPDGRRPAPAVDLQAELLPLEAWPLGRLQFQTSELDLAALHSAAPQTRLSGSATVQTRALNAPVTASVLLDNGLPGRWNEGRLPVSRLSLEVAGRADQPQQLSAPRFDLLLADGSAAAARSAGRVSGSAQWQGHTLQLQAVLHDVTPQRLDGRAAAMRVSGPLALTLDGLPSPDRKDRRPAPPWRAQWELDLEGRLDAAPQPVQLKVQAAADAQGLVVQQAHAQAGAASADLNGSLQRTPRGDWQLSSAGALADFDPLPWFPGEPGSAWRQGPHRLSGSWKFDVRLPADAAQLAQQSPLALAQRLAGNGSLRMADSLLAGVPLQADALLTYTPDQASDGGPGSLRAALRMAGNTLLLDGHGDPAGSGAGDRWRAELKAEQLAALAPLAKLHPAFADWLPRQGSGVLNLTADGRWPQLRTEGSARVQQLQWGGWALARGQADWLLDSRDSQPLSMTLDLAGLQRGHQRAEQLRGTVLGTLAAHRIDIEALLPVSPSGPGAQLLPGAASASAGAGTRAQLRAQGGWTREPAGSGPGGAAGARTSNACSSPAGTAAPQQQEQEQQPR